jgi:hypothetical protein
MKFIFTYFLVSMTIYGQCEDGEFSTDGILDNIDVQIFNDDESVAEYSIYSWTSNELNRILSGNGIPNHEVGTFPNPNNPNTISEQSVNQTFTLCPALVSENGEPAGGPAGAIAFAINSVKFDPGTAGRCNDDGECSLAQGVGNWSIEALGHETFDFGDDMNHAHVQPTGEYHYHGMPELLMDFLGGEQGMTLVGWASDGFPVYARYGYTDVNDSTSELISLQPSYRLKADPDINRPTTLTSLAGGPGQGGTNPNTPIPMGAFTQDFEYVDGLGDLDECNGRLGVTPEFPSGIYYYVVTDDFPYFTRCLKGDFDSAGGGGGGGVVNCGDVPAGAPCCGDGICGGPETEYNCPTDCATSIVPPELNSFSLSADSVNTSLSSVAVIYNIGAISYDTSLSDYSLKLILNGGPINGGEIIEESRTFNAGLYETTISGYFLFPARASEGQWNVRIEISDINDNSINMSPGDLAQKNFQNYIIVDNSSLEVLGNELPIQFSLDQNFPNPFNPWTSFQYSIPKSSIVKINVYDVRGNIIKNIINKNQSPGFKTVQWDATNNLGELVSAGLYIYSIEAGDFRQTRKMILLK